jgi:hypothetical protein
MNEGYHLNQPSFIASSDIPLSSNATFFLFPSSFSGPCVRGLVFVRSSVLAGWSGVALILLLLFRSLWKLPSQHEISGYSLGCCHQGV